MAELEIETVPAFEPIFDPAHPEFKKMFKVFRGGRGGMKSTQIAKALALKGRRRPSKILCGREFQNSIADSVHSLLSRQITALRLHDYYRVLDHSILGAKGTEFVFKGLKMNINSVKSFDGIDTLWIEEAHTISRNSIDVLFPTLREAEVEFIFSYNPDLESDPIHQFVKSLPPELVYIADVNWNDNPWFPESLRILKDLQLRRVREATSDDERALEQGVYDNVWMGKTRKNSKAQIFAGKTVIDTFEAVYDEVLKSWTINGKKADGPYYGLDFGFSVDPVAGLRCWICDECVWIDYEIYEHQLELVDHKAKILLIPGSDAHTIRADSARPEVISHLRKIAGLNVVGVEKWKDSVEEGITILRGFRKIVIHDRCRNMAHEARMYSFKVDAKTGDVLTDIVDKFNHLWDALRYALAPYIKINRPGRGYLEFYKKQAEEAAAAAEKK